MLKLLLAAWLILGITVTVVLARIFKPQKKEKLPPCETCDNLLSKDRDGRYECKWSRHRPMFAPLEYCKDYEPKERKEKNHAEM